MYRFLLRTRAIALVLSAALSLASPPHAAAKVQEALNNLGLLMAMYPDLWLFIKSKADQVTDPGSGPHVPNSSAARAASPGITSQATFYMFNNEATMEAGEPNPGGLMTKTVWGGSTPTQAGRVVIHTFGSKNFDTGGELNTVLAAYRGSAFASMVPLASNDNKLVRRASARRRASSSSTSPPTRPTVSRSAAGTGPRATSTRTSSCFPPSRRAVGIPGDL